MFKLITPAVWAGLVASVILTAVQLYWVSPLILQAEVYEQAGEFVDAQKMPQNNADHHSHHEESENQQVEEWSPANGWERSLSTAGMNLVMALGFACVLVSVYSVRRPESWRTGMAWGAAGYLVFFVAPGIGLPPELPGTQAAPLESRQYWWALTVALTAMAIVITIFIRGIPVKMMALALLLLPHLIGAPHLADEHALAPTRLIHEFQIASAIVNACFWAALGIASAYFYRREYIDLPDEQRA